MDSFALEKVSSSSLYSLWRFRGRNLWRLMGGILILYILMKKKISTFGSRLTNSSWLLKEFVYRENSLSATFLSLSNEYLLTIVHYGY